MPSIDAQKARAAKASKELPEAYPGLEPAYLPAEPLFKFKGQDPLLRGDSSTGNIRAVAGAAAGTEISVYNMAQQEMTFRDTPLNAAVSITPRHRLSRTASSLGPEISAVVRTRSSLDRGRSSLDRGRSSLADPAARSSLERVGSSMAQYDSEVNKALLYPLYVHCHNLHRLHAYGAGNTLSSFYGGLAPCYELRP